MFLSISLFMLTYKQSHLLLLILLQIWRLWEEGRALEVVDPCLSNWDQVQALLCIQLGLLCCQASVPERPDMYNVHLMLSSDSFQLPKPGKPGLQGRRGRWNTTHSLGPGKHTSSSIDPSSTKTGASKSSLISLAEDYSRNSISVSFTEEGR